MIIIKDIKDIPDNIYLKDGLIGYPKEKYTRVIIGDTTTDEYTFYADEKWGKKAQSVIDRLTTLLDKTRVEEGLEPNGKIIGLPYGLRYMAELIVIDSVVDKDRFN